MILEFIVSMTVRHHLSRDQKPVLYTADKFSQLLLVFPLNPAVHNSFHQAGFLPLGNTVNLTALDIHMIVAILPVKGKLRQHLHLSGGFIASADAFAFCGKMPCPEINALLIHTGIPGQALNTGSHQLFQLQSFRSICQFLQDLRNSSIPNIIANRLADPAGVFIAFLLMRLVSVRV